MTEERVFGVFWNGERVTGWVSGQSGQPMRFTEKEANRYLEKVNGNCYEVRRLKEEPSDQG